MRRIYFTLPLILSLSACATVAPVDPNYVPKVEQTQRIAGLNMLTRLNLPDYANTVKDAATYILQPTEYELVSSCIKCPAEARTILEQPISPLAQGEEVMSVNRALLIIGGYQTGLMVDDVNKKVAYKNIEEK